MIIRQNTLRNRNLNVVQYDNKARNYSIDSVNIQIKNPFFKMAIACGILHGIAAIALLLCCGFAGVPNALVFLYILGLGISCYMNVQFLLGMYYMANNCTALALSNEKVVELLNYISERVYEIQDNYITVNENALENS